MLRGALNPKAGHRTAIDPQPDNLEESGEMSFVKSISRARFTPVASSTKVAKVKAAKVAPVAKPAARKSSNNLTVLAKVAELGLLSKVEELKLLSKLEQSGLLSKVESAGLLRFAEKSGVITFVADPGTPSALTSVGFLLLLTAAATAYHAPENIAVDVAAAIVAILSLTAIAGGSILEKIQKL